MTHAASYIQALSFAVLFLLFISGGVGWALIYILVGMAVFSIVTLTISRKNFTVGLSVSGGMAECGERVKFSVTAEKTGFCFLPYIEVSVNAQGENIRVRTSLLFRKSAVVECSFRAAHGGLNTVTADSASLRDMFGFLRLKKAIGAIGTMAVYPAYIEYNGPEPAPKMLPAENDEEESSPLLMGGGMPGYEHREYAAGDPPKKVNYKLSAKRGKLMVRIDDPAACAPVNVLIGCGAEPVCGDIAFALARRVCGRGGTVRVEFCGESFTAASAETAERLREWLAFRRYGGASDVRADNTSADIVISGAGEISA